MAALNRRAELQNAPNRTEGQLPGLLDAHPDPARAPRCPWLWVHDGSSLETLHVSRNTSKKPSLRVLSVYWQPLKVRKSQREPLHGVQQVLGGLMHLPQVVGAIVLSRACPDDSTLADEILDAYRSMALARLFTSNKA